MAEHNRRLDDAWRQEIANEAAEAAIRKFFLTIGVDTSTPDGVIALQDDMRYIRAMRKMSSRIGQNTADTMWKILLGAGLIWLLQHFGVPTWVIEKLIGMGQ